MKFLGPNASSEQWLDYHQHARERSTVLGVFGCHTSAYQDLGGAVHIHDFSTMQFDNVSRMVT